MSRIKTPYEGVFYRERIAVVKGKKRDRTYEYCFSDNGKKTWVTVGRASQGVTAESACQARLNRLKRSAPRPDELTIGEAIEAKRRLFSDQAKLKNFDNTIRRHVVELSKAKIKDVTQADAEDWKVGLLKKLSPGGAAMVIAFVSASISEAIARGLTAAANPLSKARGFKPPKLDNKGERFLTRDEADRLIQKLATIDRDWRDMAVVSVNTGLRCGELYRVREADVNRGSMTLSVVGKSGKREVCYLNEPALEALDGRRPSPDGRYFPEKKRSKIFSRAVDALGLNDGVTDKRHRVWFHTFRHTFASWLVQGGADLYSVQKLMRHSSPNMTQRYAHLRGDDLRKVLGLLRERREA
jgi:integrase